MKVVVVKDSVLFCVFLIISYAAVVFATTTPNIRRDKKAMVNLALDDILNAVEGQQAPVVVQDGRMDDPQQQLQETIISSNVIVQFETTGENSGDNGGKTTVTTVVTLPDAISIIVRATDDDNVESSIISAIDNEILTMDEVVDIANDFNHAFIDLHVLEEFIDTIRSIIGHAEEEDDDDTDIIDDIQ